MKKILWFLVAIFGIFFTFKPFNAILIWIVSIVLNIVLQGTSWRVFQIVYYAVSGLLFLQCFYSCLSGYFYRNADPILKKYYCAIRWNIGSELFSFWCSHFAMLNFLYAGVATYRERQWWLLIASAFYYIVYTYFIGERLNPYLFLGDRAKHGDLKAIYELEQIMRIRQFGTR